MAALRDEGVVRLGGALSVATAAALRVHILAQLDAALAEEEEGIGEEEDEDEEEEEEADGADCEDADGDAAGDAAVQAMLDAFLADGGRFEETADVTDEEAGIARDDLVNLSACTNPCLSTPQPSPGPDPSPGIRRRQQ